MTELTLLALKHTHMSAPTGARSSYGHTSVPSGIHKERGTASPLAPHPLWREVMYRVCPMLSTLSPSREKQPTYEQNCLSEFHMEQTAR